MTHARAHALLLTVILAATACTSLLGNDFEVVPVDPGTGGQTATGGGGTAGTAGTGGSGGEAGGSTGDGPQLVASSPADGETEASLQPYGQLFFDRPVNYLEAAGKIRVESSAVSGAEVAQVEACVDNNPNCVRYVVPTALVEGSRLPGGTTFTVVVDQSFPDPDGHTNTVDSSISYTTFDYDPAFYTDLTISDELGGIVYVDTAGGEPINALYVTGDGPVNNSGPDIERIDLDATGQPTGRALAAQPNLFSLGSCNGDWYVAYGLDRFGDELFLSASYCNAVIGLSIEPTTGNLTEQGTFHSTLLSSPDDLLYRVESVVVAPDGSGELFYFSSGTFGSGPQVSGILQYRPLYMAPWAVWVERAGLFDAAPDFYLAGAEEAGVFVIYVANDDTIVKLDEDTGDEINRHTIAGASFQSPGLRTDSQGRLYVGDAERLTVYDTSGFNGFTELAVREGLDFRRFALREEGSTVHVYFADFRGAGDIRALELPF